MGKYAGRFCKRRGGGKGTPGYVILPISSVPFFFPFLSFSSLSCSAPVAEIEVSRRRRRRWKRDEGTGGCEEKEEAARECWGRGPFLDERGKRSRQREEGETARSIHTRRRGNVREREA